MRILFTELLRTLVATQADNLSVLNWGSPVPFFGRFDQATVATIGLNPSDREFLTSSGQELSGCDRRFHTLNSLDIRDWSAASDDQVQAIVDSCTGYFENNPYKIWFNKLDRILATVGHTYFGQRATACHVDLVPFATVKKWSSLTRDVRNELLASSSHLIGRLIRDSNVSVCILNGATVVEAVSRLSNRTFSTQIVNSWRLKRRAEQSGNGVGFSGEIDRLGGVALGRSVKILGFNHNIQSSFGITNAVHQSIADWISSRMPFASLQ